MDGNQLRNLRLSLGLTQAELATRLGVSQEMVSEMESGKRRVPEWVTKKAKGG